MKHRLSYKLPLAFLSPKDGGKGKRGAMGNLDGVFQIISLINCVHSIVISMAGWGHLNDKIKLGFLVIGFFEVNPALES